MSETLPSAPETATLAREAAAAFRGLVRGYQEHFRLSLPDALARAEGADRSLQDQRSRERPADEVIWLDLHQTRETDGEAVLHLWEQVKRAALEELQSGHRAARAVETHGSDDCWKRAQFLALRAELAEQWQPRSGIERQLLDTMAQALTSQMAWTETLTIRSSLEARSQQRDIRDHGKWTPPRVPDAAALDQAAAMVDRFNRIFLRTLRGLPDLRRYAPSIVVKAEQVTIGERQVNVASTIGRRRSKGP